MTEFGQGIIIGGIIGILCGIAASAIVVSQIVARHAAAKRQTDLMKYLKGTVSAVIAALVVVGCGTTTVTKVEVRERIDSVYVKGDTIRVVDARSDTVLVEAASAGTFKSVRAALDTTVQGVRLYLQYAYPPDRWGADIIQRDTVIKYIARDSLVQRPYPVQHVPVWIYFTLAGMSIALIVLVIATVRR